MHCVRWRTSRSRARNTTALACCASLFTGTKRMLGRCRRLADRLGIRRVVLLPLDVRLDIGRRDQPDRVPQLADLTPPVMSTAASLQRHNVQGGWAAKNASSLSRSQPFAEHHAAGRVRPVRLKHPLRDVQSDRASLRHGRLLKWSVNTSTLGTSDAVRGRPPHQRRTAHGGRAPLPWRALVSRASTRTALIRR